MTELSLQHLYELVLSSKSNNVRRLFVTFCSLENKKPHRTRRSLSLASVARLTFTRSPHSLASLARFTFTRFASLIFFIQITTMDTLVTKCRIRASQPLREFLAEMMGTFILVVRILFVSLHRPLVQEDLRSKI